MKKKKGLNTKIDWQPIIDKSFDGADRQKCMDYLILFGQYATKTEVIDGTVATKHVDMDDPELTKLLENDPPDRSKESHEQAVERYLSQIPENETLEQRKARINRFRCGY